ncbi:Crp/Fnr family transcriptional regulator [Sphingobacterium sp. SGG-5]|uniref:Crp/Fnr family transcriptional regulator n=1 Tax=Sphingobacterium sp. SGG-5 TaxID=2710881 RepID=UPI0013EDFBF3|nr:cyclic nucleotide-binding domain-containing protein [Sphingobacterium sp. SGG-5]NGM63610.1 Crp/Fnr family transcriptional regulator [Sphingobacterium sp. SGG-5]
MTYLPDQLQKTPGFELITCFAFLHPISEEIATFISGKSTYLSVKKGKFIRSTLDTKEKLYFIIRGCVRGFIKDEGQEITTWINGENHVVGSIRSLGLDQETEEHLQVIEDSLLIEIERQAIDEMYERFPEANIIGRKILERYYRDAEERAFLSRLPSAERRYRRFTRTRPELVGRIPMKYVASYLSMTLETLCRIRAKALQNPPL